RAVAIAAELGTAVATGSVRQGSSETNRHVGSSPTATTNEGIVVGDPGSTTPTSASPSTGAPARVQAVPANRVGVGVVPGAGSVTVSWSPSPGAVRLYSVVATDQASGYHGT